RVRSGASDVVNVAHSLGANLLITGTVSSQREFLVVDLEMRDLKREIAPLQQRFQRPQSELAALHDDLAGAVIDSLRFSPGWHLRTVASAGRSLERIDPDGRADDPRNWSSSVAVHRSTPAARNSIELRTAPPSSSLLLAPNPFSPDQDGHEDFLSIGYSLPSRSNTIRIRIFDVSGRLIRTLAHQEPSAAAGSILWDGRDDQGHRVRIGPYIILLEAMDNLGGSTATLKGVAVAARKLR
ncbi:MAG: hypothetical protein HUU02_03490, partial [Bacteroidetes bacterium]|nr:hypothetical protein [Bacteroidota bacterium]